jgi:hypothetical protein
VLLVFNVCFNLVCTFQPFEFEVYLCDLVMYNDHMYNDQANLFCMKEFVKKVETQTLKE